ncbi:MAG: SDR family NAD(P)-dependent oxidoreductase, partial [Bacteroidetes bacterium]
DHYAGQMQLLFNKIQQINPTPKIIYTSSTSVYGNQQGIVNEKSEIMPETENAKEIVKVEHSLIQLFEQQSIILRLSGLMGINRHPIRFLSGKINVSKPYAPVNLIHAKDIIKLIAVLIELEKDGIFNLSIPDHPTKNDYYTACCYKIGIPIPRFNLQDQTKGKIIRSIKLKELNFAFQYNKLSEYPIELT